MPLLCIAHYGFVYCTDGWVSLTVNNNKCWQCLHTVANQNFQTAPLEMFFSNYDLLVETENECILNNTQLKSPAALLNVSSLNWEQNRGFKVDKSLQITVTKAYLSAVSLFFPDLIILALSFDYLWWELYHGSVKVKLFKWLHDCRLFEINVFIYLPVMARMTLYTMSWGRGASFRALPACSDDIRSSLCQGSNSDPPVHQILWGWTFIKHAFPG